MQAGERVIPVDIEQEMKRSYLAYSMYIIVSRAIPDVRDGLKPVQRRILTAMNDLNLRPGRPYRKSAKIVGDVTGNYHPHGTVAAYDAMVRMAQDFSLRYPLVDGQGNFGSLDGDSAAAERYTEARMSRLAEDLLRDLDKETVDFVPNYDDSRTMPSVLPAVAPNLLMNGTSGIAVGMATNIPPHNLGELVDGLVALLDDPELVVDDLMAYVRGPDFPTGSVIHGVEGIRQAYRTGRGRILVRGLAEIETDERRGRDRIIITEIPYQVNKAGLIEKIAELVRSERIRGVADLRDESDREGLRIVVEMKKDAASQVILNQLYKLTPLQQAFNANMLALVNGQPRQCGLRDLMQAFLDHREEVVVRRTQFELKKAEERAHIVQGLLIGVENIDELVQLIKSSADTEEARSRIRERFGLSELQAQAILDMRLAKLTGLEREKLEAEYAELQEAIARYRAILADRGLVLAIIKEELFELKQRYPDPRRTEIAPALGEFEAEDLIAEEDMVITISHAGYVKRTPLDQYRRQRRGGRGVRGMDSREEDFIEHVMVASSLDTLLVFTNLGRVYQLKVWELPQGARAARGKALVNLLNLRSDEKPRDFVRVEDFMQPHRYVMLASARGLVKRTPLSHFATRRRDGIIAQGMKDDDTLVRASLVSPGEEILLSKRLGRALRFNSDLLRPMGRTARGVRGVALRGEDDRVVDMLTLRGQQSVLTITENGFGKRTTVEDYPARGRGGLGTIDIKTTKRNGPVVATLPAWDDDEIILITRGGKMVRMGVSGISLIGRNTQGVKIVSLDEGDKVVSVAVIPQERDPDDDGE
ncbi:MAG: DNA gyrase subunit A [Candidatus Krumholzibacteriota bacterium]|nr:DNA gyrase subunit A [Candidatus Krumholzibacteriota bacterium]